MTTFQPNPVNGDETDDGKFVFADPPGAWKINSLAQSLSQLDEDLVILAAANNAHILAQIAELPPTPGQLSLLEAYVDERLAGFSPSNPQSQNIVEASGETQIDLRQGTTATVLATSSTWYPVFINRFAGATHVFVVVNTTNANDDMTLPAGFVWEGTAPATFDAGKRYTFEFVVLEDNTGTVQWLGAAVDVAPPAVVAPTLSLSYSTSQSRTSPLALNAATLPAGNVVVFATTTDNSVVSRIRFFINHTGALPALGEESTAPTWVGSRTLNPYSMLGQVPDSTLSNFWDTNVDPTGNSNAEFDKNGSNTITIDAELVDGTLTSPVTATFTLSNTEPTADPVWTFTQTGYTSATATHPITIPSGVDRALVVHAFYSASIEMTGATFNGVQMAMSENQFNLTAQEWGQAIFTLTEPNLSTGTFTFEPTFSGSRTIPDTVVYKVWVYQNLASPNFIHDSSYTNIGVSHSEVNTLTAVPANSFIMTSAACQGDSTATPHSANLSGDLVSDLLVVDNSWKDVSSRAETETDSGVLGDRTITWSNVAKRGGALSTALAYATSGGGPETPPIIPGTPVISSVVAGDNKLTVTWGATADAASYQIRWGSTDPPARTPVAVSGLTREITGLVANALQYVQVRAVSSTGDVGPWSASASGTPTGVEIPPPQFLGKFPTTTNARECSMTEGNQPANWGDVVIPTPYRRINIGQTPQNSADAIKAGWDWADLFIGRWQSARKTAYAQASGPRLIITGRMAFNSTWSPHLRWNENPQLAIDAVLSMMKIGSTGSVENYDWVWHSIGNDLNRTVVKNGQSFNLWEHIFYSVSHEAQAWSSHYWGTNTNLINRPEFSPTNISQTRYGKTIADAANIVYNTGYLAPLHKAVAEHIITEIRSRCPQAIIGFTPAESGGSVPVGTPTGNLSNAWTYDAFPEKGMLDFICPTDYPFRGSGSLVFQGGDVNDPANWTKSGGEGFLTNSLAYANAWGCAYGLLEYSGSYAYPGNTQGLSPGVGTYSDADVAMIHRRFFEVELPSAQNGLAFVNHWLFPTWDQSKADPGRSWMVLEGCYGALPTGTTFSSTSKPSWSTAPGSDAQGTLWYQKSLDWFRETFPPY